MWVDNEAGGQLVVLLVVYNLEGYLLLAHPFVWDTSSAFINITDLQKFLYQMFDVHCEKLRDV